MALASKIAVLVILFLYIVASAVVVVMHLNFEDTLRNTGHVASRRLHGPLMLGGIICMGFGLLVFRVFRGMKTRIVKYFHLVFHTIAAALFIAGYFMTSNYKDDYMKARQTFIHSNTTTRGRVLHLTSFAHITVGYLFLACFILQYLVAFIIFIYQYENKKMRLYFAPFHDIIGIWLFLCYVGTYLTGIYFLFESHLGFLPGKDAEDAHDEMHILTIPIYLCFLIVLAVVLSPFFEWELVGPL